MTKTTHEANASSSEGRSPAFHVKSMRPWPLRKSREHQISRRSIGKGRESVGRRRNSHGADLDVADTSLRDGRRDHSEVRKERGDG